MGPNSGTVGEDTVSRIFRAASWGCEIDPGAGHGKRRREWRDLAGAVGHRGRLASPDASHTEPGGTSTWSELGDSRRSLDPNGESRLRRLIGAIVNATDPSDPCIRDGPWRRGGRTPGCRCVLRARVRRTVTAADRRPVPGARPVGTSAGPAGRAASPLRGGVVRLWRGHARTRDASNRCRPSHSGGHPRTRGRVEPHRSRTWPSVSSAQLPRSLGAEPSLEARAVRLRGPTESPRVGIEGPDGSCEAALLITNDQQHGRMISADSSPVQAREPTAGWPLGRRWREKACRNDGHGVAVISGLGGQSAGRSPNRA